MAIWSALNILIEFMLFFDGVRSLHKYEEKFMDKQHSNDMHGV